MSDRITEKNLKALCDSINEELGTPMQPYAACDPATNEGRTMKGQIGNHHISFAYGGVCLHRMHNEGGGVSCPIGMGHVPKRELYDRMQAYLSGITAERS